MTENSPKIEKNTISYLNSRVWYRLVKVIYMALFLIVIICWCAYFLEWISRISNENSKIFCYSREDPLFIFPEKHLNFLLKDLGLTYLNENFFSKNKMDYSKIIAEDLSLSEKIAVRCINIVNEWRPNFKTIKNGDVFGGDDIITTWKKDYETKFWQIFDIEIERFYLKWIQEVLFGLWASLLYVAIMCIIFEALKRTFYYIILGSIFPKK